jgi:DNA-binding GntR family transcriptional regulator
MQNRDSSLNAKIMDDLLNILTTFEPNNVAEEIYVKLKRMLFDYEIVPGQKLQCQDLAEKFRVSRTPVKDALNKLEREGYVELRHNRGYYVGEIGLEEAEELYEIREALETLAIQKAVNHFDRKSLESLRQAMEAYSADVEKGVVSRGRLILDANFHLKIAEAGGSKSLFEMLRTIFSKIYLRHRIDNLPPERSRIADNEHQEIFDALSSKDTSVALKRMKKHLNLGRENMLGSLTRGRESR